VSLGFFPEKILGTITFNPHTFADEIKRHPEVEIFLVTRETCTKIGSVDRNITSLYTDTRQEVPAPTVERVLSIKYRALVERRLQET